jgi:hypothetical protein
MSNFGVKDGPLNTLKAFLYNDVLCPGSLLFEEFSAFCEIFWRKKKNLEFN